MDPQITLSRRAFYLGLIIMLGAGTASAGTWSGEGNLPFLCTIAGATMAILAHLWRNRLMRSFRRHHTYNHFRRPAAGSDRMSADQQRRAA